MNRKFALVTLSLVLGAFQVNHASAFGKKPLDEQILEIHPRGGEIIENKKKRDAEWQKWDKVKEPKPDTDRPRQKRER